MTSKHNTAQRRAEDAEKIAKAAVSMDRHPEDFVEELMPLGEDPKSSVGDVLNKPSPAITLRLKVALTKVVMSRAKGIGDRVNDDGVLLMLTSVLDEYWDFMPPAAKGLLLVTATEIFERTLECGNPDVYRDLMDSAKAAASSGKRGL